MPRNNDLTFDPPQPVVRTSARIKDEAGNLFDITLTGPDELVRMYVEIAPLHLRLRALDQPPTTERSDPNAPYEEPKPTSDLTPKE